jgi:hypothetical protein
VRSWLATIACRIVSNTDEAEADPEGAAEKPLEAVSRVPRSSVAVSRIVVVMAHPVAQLF